MTGLLEGMRVLDAGIWRPVPHATQLLADLGAEVVKLEPPGGDPMRRFPDLFAGVAGHKRSVVVDLKDPAGRERALALAAGADVFCEGWRPGVAERLGVGYEDVRAVNPRVIYVSVSGYGQDGPLARQPGHDLNYQALAGALATGAGDRGPPAIPRLPVADLAGGTMAALLVCAAWARRQRDGDSFAGERIDVSMTDVVASWAGPSTHVAMDGVAAPVHGSPGYGVFRCIDGAFVTLAVISEDHFWAAVCDALGLGDVRDVPYAERLGRIDELNELLAGAIGARTRDDVLAALLAAGAPVAPVLTPEEASVHPQSVARRTVVPDPSGTPRVRFPARLEHHPARDPGPPPTLDEHHDHSF